MSLKVNVELRLPEVAALAALRGAVLSGISERLVTAMKARIDAGFADGDLRRVVLEKKAKAKKSRITGDEVLLTIVREMLLAEVEEVSDALEKEAAREADTAAKAIDVMRAYEAPPG